MDLGRYLIKDFTAADGYKVIAPEEVRVAEISPTKTYARVIWDHGKNDQSWESLPLLEKSVIETLAPMGPNVFYTSVTSVPPQPFPFRP